MEYFKKTKRLTNKDSFYQITNNTTVFHGFSSTGASLDDAEMAL